ncbi:serine/threonine-protein kinase haspin homolog isoform X2 [Drosophila biarmipes]|uniref:serine/threonine-protein kinase haspin homolog isoform X2 n=1 Tax=Drosophila biarmipes TaxID=125945 RepID=UPI0021CD10CD|nr:serine/threonine-protein kinase haspin homolog isoform X2 [Drosophila biarmipes]
MDKSSGDERWKDSFDKLLEPRSQMCNPNLKSVRVSFNIDTSVENSTYSIKGCTPKSSNRCGSISTPNYKGLDKDLFNCTLSPINCIQLDGFRGSTDKCYSDKDDELITIKRDGLVVPLENKIERCSKWASYGSKRLSNQSNTIVGVSNQSNKTVGVLLKPGKWRKSLNIFRRTQLNVINVSEKSENTSSVCQNRKTTYLKDLKKGNIICQQDLFKYCNQDKPFKFNDAYSQYKMLNTHKIGEGAYGEVFRYNANLKECSKHKNDIVLKIIPIDGSIEVNGEKQKTFSQIWPEIIITNKMSSIQGFANMKKVLAVKGKYPQHFLKLWERYDDKKGSENDHPGLFRENQLFIVLELHFAGCDMSKFTFLNAEQSYYALQQIIISLAVGEEDYQFEHRDLHLGNLLIKTTTKKHVSFKFNNMDLMVLSKGVNTTIIDYTLSRITIDDCCYFNDLSNDDELFLASGDYQYDIYRMMRNELKRCCFPEVMASVIWRS